MWSRAVDRIRPRTALRWLLPAAWPVRLTFGAAAATTLLVAALTTQPAIGLAVVIVITHDVFGLWASFAIHELGHAVVLGTAPGVSAITLERTSLRLSVTPHGSILGRDAFLAAVLGPLCCVAIGLLLWALAPQSFLHIWYLVHGVFLTPLFSDGRTMLRAAAAWRARIPLPGSDSGPEKTV
ncbi:hypothetical protein [Microbacterium saperdae]|uniref:Uncharacterized protein n=1 Tax=Microbacterium saperdae TaxID=69368 RepID=A0A543BBU0_9MICO|nr:hypothetical protein [Microbacterium saperdae]TQL82311.1 hypothetical protein FB560_3795 [Microbacterium saperdae]GGM38830.1 hypothetical protein GCM10010489_07300 [Microbacterium saperdae]